MKKGSTRRFNVKVKPLKLEGFFCKEKVEDEDHDHGGKEKTIVVQMKWNGPKSVFVPFYLSSSSKRHRRSCSTGQRFLRNGEESVEWDDDEFESICDFSIVSKDGSFGSWVVSFTVLYGEISNIGESKTNKLASLGKASLNLAQVAAKMESKVELKLPIISSKAEATDATLLVCVSFVEVTSSRESSGLVQNSTESDKGDAFFKMVMDLTGYKKKMKKKNVGQKDQANSSSSSGSDKSAVFDSSEGSSSPGNESIIDSSRNNTQLSSSPSKEGRLSFTRSRKKGEPSIKNTRVNNNVKNVADVHVVDPQPSSYPRVADPITSGTILEGDATQIYSENESYCNTGNWEMKELVSRDGQTKLKSNVFFASFDQRSEKAAGESACTALVAVIADWLHSNQDFMPTRPEYDTLITEGSSEWRKLCDNEAYTNFFPDKHFDLETVLDAGLKPITVLPEKSFTGFFSPEKFEILRGAMSFDEIWDEITNNTEDYRQPRVYIVSWNDHFFVLKVEADAYYIIDSLGERLFEGCNQAYILKFDDSTSMYAKAAKEEVGSVDMAPGDENAGQKEEVGSDNMATNEKASHEEESEEMICGGKECCKEYIKRFLAAIPIGEFEAEEKKGTASTFSLHRRLQIDFHYSSSASSSSSSSSATSSTHSLFTSD
ncbi:hypothetical protein JRO89_XS03G0254800 [Xanthoceras sorbifolium]|uniref:C2 NT-type domain-containing protein n=1 Tax=Xanthoceras sorbifolium TaxID=99658 RepID=A0ABQ8IC36_9ROSI|nr:hypothetical protein JRO89_XS03G0254800 [Xanthoceras sorbifolium]